MCDIRLVVVEHHSFEVPAKVVSRLSQDRGEEWIDGG